MRGGPCLSTGVPPFRHFLPLGADSGTLSPGGAGCAALTTTHRTHSGSSADSRDFLLLPPVFLLSYFPADLTVTLYLMKPMATDEMSEKEPVFLWK